MGLMTVVQNGRSRSVKAAFSVTPGVTFVHLLRLVEYSVKGWKMAVLDSREMCISYTTLKCGIN